MAEGEVVMEVVESVGLQVRAGVKAVRRGSEMVQGYVKQAVRTPMEEVAGVWDPLFAALTDTSPLPMDVAGGRRTLGAYFRILLLLTAVDVGRLMGRVLGGLLLGPFFTPAALNLASLLLIPGAYLLYIAVYKPKVETQNQGVTITAFTSGALHAYAIREYGVVSAVPMGLTGLIWLMVTLLMGPEVGQERTKLLGTLVGVRGAVVFLLDLLMMGSISMGGILNLGVVSAALAGWLQLYWAERVSPGLGWSLRPEMGKAILHIALILPLLTSALIFSPFIDQLHS